jgi:hypothetical protein
MTKTPSKRAKPRKDAATPPAMTGTGTGIIKDRRQADLEGLILADKVAAGELLFAVAAIEGRPTRRSRRAK